MLYHVHYDFIYKCFLEKTWWLATILLQKSLVMRIRIAYKINGKETLEEGQISNFPRNIWSQMVGDHSGDAQSPTFFTHIIITFAVFMFHSFKWGGSRVQETEPLSGSKLTSVWWLRSLLYIFFFSFLGCLCILVQNIPIWKCQNQIFPFKAQSIVSRWKL